MNIDRENLRLQLLIKLSTEAGYTSNQEILRRALHEAGLVVTRDAVRCELAWLDNIGAVVNRESGGVFIAVLTDEGYEHLQGARNIPGIRKPGPGELR